MMFNFILLLALGAFIAGSAGQKGRPDPNTTAQLGPGGSGSSPSVSPGTGSAAFGPGRKNSVQNAQLGPGSFGSVAYGPVFTGPFLNEPAYSCGANEVYQRCGVGSQCEDYCGRGANACAYCEDGCYCKPGYIRSGPGYKSKCIPKNSCPRQAPAPTTMAPTTAQPVCGAHEVYRRCGVGSQCEDYCGRGANACAFCEDGCYCKRGYIRSGPGYKSKCIKKNSCPVCGANEVYQRCGVGSQCEDYCGRGANACAYCEDGCYCKSGYIRSGPGNKSKCIKKNSCPQQCPKNEVYNSCGGCDQYCGSGPIACTQDCSNPGCYCQSGFVRTYPGGICIPPGDCDCPEYSRNKGK